MSGTGVRLEFPHKVKFHTDSCPWYRSMITAYTISTPVADAARMSYRIRYGGIEGGRSGT